MRQMSAGHVKEIMKLCLKLAKFTNLGRCFKQCRGSLAEEAMWIKGRRIMMDSRRSLCWFGRYVDNRFMAFPRKFLSEQGCQDAVSRDSYRDPVILEPSDAGELLGCVVDATAGMVEFRPPKDAWQWPLNSAGSCRLNLGSFRPHLRLIKRRAYDKHVVSRQLRALKDCYLSLGFTRFHHAGFEQPCLTRRFGRSCSWRNG